MQGSFVKAPVLIAAEDLMRAVLFCANVHRPYLDDFFNFSRLSLAFLFKHSLQYELKEKALSLRLPKLAAGFSSSQVEHVKPDDDPALMPIISCCLRVNGFNLVLLNCLLLSLALILFSSDLLYSEAQDLHQLASPDATLLFGANAEDGSDTLHFEHDLVMRRILP